MKNKKRCKLKVVPIARGTIHGHMTLLGKLQREIVSGRVESIAVAVTRTNGGYMTVVSLTPKTRKTMTLGAVYELLSYVQALPCEHEDF